jgi:hypothetical protein
MDPSTASKGIEGEQEQEDTMLEEINLDTTPVVHQKELEQGAGEGEGEGVDAREAETREDSTAYSATEVAGVALSGFSTAPPPPAAHATPVTPSILPASTSNSSAAPSMQRTSSQQSAKASILYSIIASLTDPQEHPYRCTPSCSFRSTTP